LGVVGIVIIVVILLFIFGVFNNRSDSPTTTLEASANQLASQIQNTATIHIEPTATIPPPETGLALILSAGSRASIINDQGEKNLTTNERVAMDSGVTIRSGSESLELLLSDSTWLLLGSETDLELAAVVGQRESIDTQLILQEGIVIMQASSKQSHLIRLANPHGEEVQIASGRGGTIVGVIFDARLGVFDVDCLALGDCDLISRNNSGVNLKESEWGSINNDGAINEIGPARYELYAHLAGIVPTLTPTMTSTPSLTPTPTRENQGVIPPTLTPTPQPQAPNPATSTPRPPTQVPPPPTSTSPPTGIPTVPTVTKTQQPDSTPTKTPNPTRTSEPTRTPNPTNTSPPTQTPFPANTPEPTITPSGCNVPNPPPQCIITPTPGVL
jgi:hypothetical protein